MTLPVEVLKKYLEVVGLSDVEFTDYRYLLEKSRHYGLTETEQKHLDDFTNRLTGMSSTPK